MMLQYHGLFPVWLVCYVILKCCNVFSLVEVQAIASMIEKQAQIVVKPKDVSEESKKRKEALLAQYANVTDDEEYPLKVARLLARIAYVSAAVTISLNRTSMVIFLGRRKLIFIMVSLSLTLYILLIF